MLDRQKANAPPAAETIEEDIAATEKRTQEMTEAEKEEALHSHVKVDQAFDKIYDKYLKTGSQAGKKLSPSEELLNSRSAKKNR